jgi:xanthine dehydrogenase accessory factor
VEESTALCILTHDPKFDVPLLQVALGTKAGYIGAMGSLRTQAARMRELAAAGVSPDQLARIKGPIGLDIGARSPEEVAVAIAAEIIAVRHQRPALSLSGREGPIHPESGRVQAATEGNRQS